MIRESAGFDSIIELARRRRTNANRQLCPLVLKDETDVFEAGGGGTCIPNGMI